MIKLKTPPEPVNLKNEKNQMNVASSLASYFWDACGWEETLTKKDLNQTEFVSLLRKLETSLDKWQKENMEWQQVLDQLATLLQETFHRRTGKNEKIEI